MKFKHVLFSSIFLMLSIVCLSFESDKERVMEHPENFVMLTNEAGNSGGTGFSIISPSGKLYTLTNAHVCDGVSKDGYIFGHDAYENRQIKLKVIEVSDFTDLCLVESMPKAIGLEVSNRDVIRNDKLFSLGFPTLEPLTYIEGLKTADMSVLVALEEVPIEKCILPKHKIMTMKISFFGIDTEVKFCAMSINATLTNLKIYPGNSGSPVMNMDGKVVGVMFAAGSSNNGNMIKLGDIKKFLSIY